MTDVNELPVLSAELGPLELRVRQMLAAGRPAAARPMLRVLRARGAADEVLAELDARLCIVEGRPEDAVTALGQAVAVMPGIAGLHACRAEALVHLDQPGRALADAAEAVLLAPQASDAKALLGLVLIEAGQPGEAAQCLAEAVGAEPCTASYRLALAEALHRLGRAEDAGSVLREGIRLQPRDLALRRAAMFHAVRAGCFAEAVGLGRAAHADWVVDAAVMGLLGHALGATGEHGEASKAYAEASRLDPDDAYVRHLAAAGGAGPAGAGAPGDYVRVVFDGYAPRFDDHLISLGYRVPGLVRAMLEGLPGVSGPVTDLGCGTGLLAVACDDLAGPWTGVDLSTAMLERANARGLYQRVVTGDIAAVLPGLPPAGLVLAGDVFCYLGELDGILGAVGRHLRPRGHAVFSLEDGGGADGFAIGGQGRFRHSETYARACCGRAGLSVLEVRREVLRLEDGAPVAGLIVAVEAVS